MNSSGRINLCFTSLKRDDFVRTERELKEWLDLTKERQGTWDLVDAAGDVVWVCTKFDVFKVNEPDLQQRAIKQINEDFDRGLLL